MRSISVLLAYGEVVEFKISKVFVEGEVNLKEQNLCMEQNRSNYQVSQSGTYFLSYTDLVRFNLLNIIICSGNNFKKFVKGCNLHISRLIPSCTSR